MSTRLPSVEQVIRGYLDGADGDAQAALRHVVVDALADLAEMERRSAQKDRLISRGYVRASGPSARRSLQPARDAESDTRSG